MKRSRCAGPTSNRRRGLIFVRHGKGGRRREIGIDDRGWQELWHQLRRAHAVEMAREGVPLIVIERQLGHSNLGITSV
jgi:integrase